MRAQTRKVGIALLIAFLALFAQLNYVQIFAAEDIATNRANIRSLIQQYSIARGDILTRDFERIATSKKTNRRLKYLRTYPGGDLYGHITGFFSIKYGATRIENSFNDELLGESAALTMQDIEDEFLGSGKQGDDVRLTISSRLQQVARAALGSNRGAVVALEPRTGEVLAMWSNPSFDPGPLAEHDGQTQTRYWNSLNPKSPDTPLLNLATSRGYPPGSTIKVIAAAAALESGRYTARSTFPDPVALDLPQSPRDLMNFTRTTCTGGGRIDLFYALEISCDTTFGIIGMELHDDIREMATRFGFNEPLPFDIGTEASAYPEIGEDNQPFQAYSAIGQGDVIATPLQMALVAAGVANGGEVPRPRLVKEVLDPSGEKVEEFEPEVMDTAMSPDVAETVTEMMVAVVRSGTGTAAQLPGVEVAGKTGTAQTGTGEAPHAWFISFAPADDPEIAVAVIVENGGAYGSEATGGRVAAPVARAVMEADRQIRGW